MAAPRFSQGWGVRSHMALAPDTSPEEPVKREDTEAAGEQKSAVLGIDDALASLLRLSEPGVVNTPQQALAAYEQSSAVFIPINMIASKVSQVEPVIEDTETGEQIKKHPLLSRLRRPHPVFPRQLFLDALARNWLITGEAPVVSLGPVNRPPLALEPLSPKEIAPVANDETGIPQHWTVIGPLAGQYEWDQTPNYRYFSGPDRELKVLRSWSTKHSSLLRGQTRLVSASKDVRQQIEGADYNISLLTNGGRTSLIFHFKSNLDPKVFAERKEQILSQYAGTKNAGKVAVTAGGEMDIKEGGGSARDMEYGQTLNRTSLSLALCYDVPIVLISLEASTLSNRASALLALWDDAATPTANKVLGELGEWLMPRYNLDPEKFRLTFDQSKIEALLERTLAQLKTRSSAGLETIDELRGLIPGRGDVPGGNELLVSAVQVPLSQLVDEGED